MHSGQTNFLGVYEFGVEMVTLLPLGTSDMTI